MSIEGSDNRVWFESGCSMDDCSVVIRGNGNNITIGASRLTGCSALVSGDENNVLVADGCTLRALGMVCEDNGNVISISEGTEVSGATNLDAIEGRSITIGSRCLFSSGIRICTGDSHSLTDMNGRRQNPSADVAIGHHVWVGADALVLKGVSIADSCVIGARSVLTRRFDEPHCVIAGSPATVVRTGVDWCIERILDGPPETRNETASNG